MTNNIREKLVELLDKAENHYLETARGAESDSERYAIIKDAYGVFADFLIANGVTIQQWIPVTERLPEPEREVLVQCERRPSSFKYQCKAFYVPQKWLRDESAFNWDYECCDEYDEEADDYYVNEGWYERVHNWDDYNAVGIGDFVTHWMPLPQPPKGE